MMELNKTQKIIISVVVVVLLLGAYIFMDRKGANKEPIIPTTTDDQNTGSYTIEQVPIENNLPKPIPDLNRQPVVYPGAIIAQEAKTLAVKNIKSLQATLKNNPKDTMSWIILGTNYKNAGDYDGAIISWKYAGKLLPTDYVSSSNLGNLYAYYLKDNGMAEVYYKEAISKSPEQAYLYVQLAEAYIDVFKDKDKALAIINKGLEKVPGDSRLLQLKSSL